MFFNATPFTDAQQRHVVLGDLARPCQLPRSAVEVDRHNHCMSCGFEPYSHEETS
jgi:hypothetical protein